jgi:hypothetical protein
MGGANKAKERYSDELKVGEDGIITEITLRGAALAREHNLGKKDLHAA